MPAKTSPQSAQNIGVLLLNLGTPDATDFWSMRRYLKEFLWDRRVIETPRWQWWPILNLIILNTRPKKSGALYDKIWDRQANDSPLRVIGNRQVEKLSKRLKNSNVFVDFAMRYGNPSIEAGISSLMKKGCDRLLLVPLYPQYSAPTTASANDKAFDALKAMRWQPTIRIAPPYYDNSAYIGAMAASIASELKSMDFVPERLVFSYHGMPQEYIDRGDPYYEHCKKTTALVGAALGWPSDKIIMAFQSRFGPTEWLKPYLDETLVELPKSGVRNIAVLAPAFSVDCLETLEELAMEGKETFLEAGGKNFAYIPCLNDTKNGMDVIESIVRQELMGWVPDSA